MRAGFDGDGLVYRAGFATQRRSTELSHALHVIKLIINSVLKVFTPSEFMIVLSSPHKSANFRYKIDPEYKANRSNNAKPIHYEAMREYLLTNFPSVVVDWGEADDYLGSYLGSEDVCVSSDKDLRMIPGWHRSLHTKEIIKAEDPGKLWLKQTSVKGAKTLQGTGFKWFCAQMLLGDGVDNIIKCKAKFKDVKTFELLHPINDPVLLWETIKKMYKDESKESVIMKQACLLWISRKPRQLFDESIVEELQKQYDIVKELREKGAFVDESEISAS